MSDSQPETRNPPGLFKYSKKDLDPFFEPSSVVIIGASRNTFTFNGMILKNLLELRFPAERIHVVNPNAEEIHGIRPLKRIQDLPETPDLAIVVTRHDVLNCLRVLGRRGVRHVLLESDLAPAVLEEHHDDIRQVVEQYDMVVVGPSTIGIINYPANFSTSIIPTRIHILEKNRGERKSVGLSFLAQSGGLAGSFGWWSPSQLLPISKVVHLGSERAYTVREHHILRYLFEDDETRVIALFLKDISPELVQVMERYKGLKPVLFKTVGHPARAQDLEQAGAIQVRDYIDLFEIGKMFLWSPLPKGPRLGIIGPSSGAISLFLGEMADRGLELAHPTPETRDYIHAEIQGSVPARGNPVDFWPPAEFVGTKICHVYDVASRALLADPNVDGLFLALEFFNEIEFDFAIFHAIQRRFPDKPIVAVLIHAEHDGAKRIMRCSTQLRIPVFENEVERAVRGYHALLRFARLADGLE